MNIFENYAEYYDLIYQEKNYAEEADFIHHIIKRHHPDAELILDIGCGTGNHAFCLHDRGYQVTGIDMSAANIKKALSKVSSLNQKTSGIQFKRADARSASLKCSFDVAISLFHVMSYQTTNEDLKAAFRTAKNHLNEGGLFIFDCWYGPAVLSEGLTVRTKNVENESFKIKRKAEPELLPNDNIVLVNYHLVVQDKETNKTSEITETHKMRYLFRPEILHFLNETGFELLGSAEWMTDNPPGLDTWSVHFISKHLR
jgi:SAM-dependent methyltransferase